MLSFQVWTWAWLSWEHHWEGRQARFWHRWSTSVWWKRKYGRQDAEPECAVSDKIMRPRYRTDFMGLKIRTVDPNEPTAWKSWTREREGILSRSRKKVSRHCIKIEEKFNTTRLNAALGGQKRYIWTLGPSLMYWKLCCYIGHWSTRITTSARRLCPGCRADPRRRPVGTTRVALAYYRGPAEDFIVRL